MAADTWGVSWGGTTGSWITSWARTLVEIPDVVGETQAAGTTELETALFVVAVETEYSALVAVGVIISQDPVGGSFANPGSTVTIVVSLGPEPEVITNLGGDDAPPRKQKDYRPELDEKRLSEQQELRRTLERAAGLIDEAEEAVEDEPPEIRQQVETAKVELGKLRAYAEALTAEKPDLEAAQRRVDELIAKSADELIVQIMGVLTDLIQEIADDDD